jgi:hypothetical protein
VPTQAAVLVVRFVREIFGFAGDALAGIAAVEAADGAATAGKPVLGSFGGAIGVAAHTVAKVVESTFDIGLPAHGDLPSCFMVQRSDLASAHVSGTLTDSARLAIHLVRLCRVTDDLLALGRRGLHVQPLSTA